MGMDLINRAGVVFDLSASWWWFYRILAQEYGWEPKGTGRPDHLSETEEWSGLYDSCDGQIVHKDDAYALAAALTKALADLNSETLIDEMLDEWQKNFEKQTGMPLSKPSFDVEFTRELIHFCNSGEFRIE